MDEEETERNDVLPWMTEKEIQSGHIIPWKRIGNYLHQHRQVAKWTEAVLYGVLCATLYQIGKEALGYNNYSSRCQIPQTQNIQGADTPERFIRVGRETFYSHIDGKEISDVVK